MFEGPLIYVKYLTALLSMNVKERTDDRDGVRNSTDIYLLRVFQIGSIVDRKVGVVLGCVAHR